MRTIHVVVCSLVLLLGLAVAAAAQEPGEPKVNNKKIPPAVSAAAAKAFPNAKIKGWSKETEEGKTFYEAEMTEGTVKRDVIFLPDGKIDVVEEEIPLSAVPAAVQNALKAKYPKATVDVAEKLIRGNDVQYELHLKKAPKKEVVYAPDGKLIKEE